jgi:hypothetical protein
MSQEQFALAVFVTLAVWLLCCVVCISKGRTGLVILAILATVTESIIAHTFAEGASQGTQVFLAVLILITPISARLAAVLRSDSTGKSEIVLGLLVLWD